MTLLQLLSQGWIGTTVGVLGVALAVLFYRRSKPKSRLAYQSDHVTVVGGSRAAFSEDVEIRFAGTPVPLVTKSQYVVWNAGNTLARGSDVVASDALRLETSHHGRILKYAIAKQTRPANGWVLSHLEPRALRLEFDFLNPGDGVFIEVIHSTHGAQLELKGTLRGFAAGVENFGRASWSFDNAPGPFRLNWRTIYSVGLTLGVLLTAYGILQPRLAAFLPEALRSDARMPAESLRILLVGLGLMYIALPAAGLWSRRRRHPAGLEPLDDSATVPRRPVEPAGAA